MELSPKAAHLGLTCSDSQVGSGHSSLLQSPYRATRAPPFCIFTGTSTAEKQFKTESETSHSTVVMQFRRRSESGEEIPGEERLQPSALGSGGRRSV